MDIDKFYTVRDFSLNTSPIVIRGDKDLDIIVVYCIWSNRLYLKLFYISLLSQIRFTDIHRTRICLFVSSDIYEEAAELLAESRVEIIRVDESFRKYSVFDHSVFTDFEGKIVLCDCDTFFYSHDGSFPLYSIFSCQEHGSVWMMEDPDIVSKVFFDRKCLLLGNDRFMPDGDYASAWSDILSLPVESILPKGNWKLSCCAVFDSSFINHRDWKKHAQESFNFGTGCDETVFLTFAWSHGIPVKDLEQIPAIQVARTKDCIKFLDNPVSGIGILHPLHGDYCHHLSEVQRIYNTIIGETQLVSFPRSSRERVEVQEVEAQQEVQEVEAQQEVQEVQEVEAQQEVQEVQEVEAQQEDHIGLPRESEGMFFKFHNIKYPSYCKKGPGSRFIQQFASEYCHGVGINIGYGKEEWSFFSKGTVLLDILDGVDCNQISTLPEVRERKFDFVFSSHTLEHLKDWKFSLKDWFSCLKGHGIVFLYLPHPDMLYWHPDYNSKHKHILTPNLIEEYLYSLGFVYVLTSGVDLYYSFCVVGFKCLDNMV